MDFFMNYICKNILAVCLGYIMLQCGSITSYWILSYTTATISAVLCLITIPGNLLICLAVYIDPYRRLRTPFNIVVANLAFADLLVGCITEPLSIYLHIKEGLGREIKIIELRALHFSYFISCTASVLSLSLLALERYISISYSVKYRTCFKVRRFVLVSLVVWLIAIGLSIVYVLTSYVFYTFVFINIAVFWTLGVTTFCYVKILRKLKKVEKVRVQESTVTSNANTIKNICSLSKAYVLPFGQNGTNSPMGRDNNIKNDQQNGQLEPIEEVVCQEGSCSSQLGSTPSGSEENNVSKTKNNDNTTSSSSEIDKVVKLNAVNAGFNLSDEILNVNDLQCPQEGSSYRSETTQGNNVGDDMGHEKTPFPQQGTVIGSPITTYMESMSNKYNILVTKTFILVSLMFLACYTPALMIIYTMNWCHSCSCLSIHIMRDMQFVVVIINSSINPFLYSIRFAHFRRAISKILQDVKKEILL